MNEARRGKIAHLPRVIREELNARLDNGEDGKSLVAWLNALPEVRALLAGKFRSRPISEQNLSLWRRGGFRDWQSRRETSDLAERFHAEAAAAETKGAPALSEKLTHWVAAHYAVSSRRLAAAEGEEQWRLLRQMCGDVVRLRRSDHTAERMDLQRERLAVNLQMAEIKAHARSPNAPPDQG